VRDNAAGRLLGVSYIAGKTPAEIMIALFPDLVRPPTAPVGAGGKKGKKNNPDGRN